MTHPIINITSAEIQVRYSDISEMFCADIIINGMMKVTSEFSSKEPGVLYELMRDSGIIMREVKLSFKHEPRKYSSEAIIITTEKRGEDHWCLMVVINGNDFEYPMQPDSIMELFKMGCKIIKK